MSTSLVALHVDTGARLTISDTPLDDLRALSNTRKLICPFCGTGMLLKAGKVRLHHFAHLSVNECASADHEPETDAHRLGKLRLYHHFRSGAQGAQVERGLPSGQRADVFIERSERNYALEFQQADNTADKWNGRHTAYRDQGICDVWLLGIVRYKPVGEPGSISRYDPLPVPHTVFAATSVSLKVREMEKAMLSAFPLLYYLDPESNKVSALIPRNLRSDTLRAYRYQFDLSECSLENGELITPLTPYLRPYLDLGKGTA